MSLPYDIARCHGTDHPVCSDCRRREPGRAEWPTYIKPPVDVVDDSQCEFYIPPASRTTTKAVQR